MLRGLNPESAPLVLTATRGRVRLKLACLRLGADLCVTLSGGDREHLGAVALAGPDTPPAVLAVPGHREDDLAKALATRLSAQCGAVVCLACGIHLDRITPSEIQVVRDLSAQLTEELIRRLEAPDDLEDPKNA